MPFALENVHAPCWIHGHDDARLGGYGGASLDDAGEPAVVGLEAQRVVGDVEEDEIGDLRYDP